MSEADEEIRKLQEQRKNNDLGISLTGQGQFDSSIYGDVDKSVYSNVVYDEEEEEGGNENGARMDSSSSRSRMRTTEEDVNINEAEYRAQFGSGLVNTRISDRESEVSSRIMYNYYNGEVVIGALLIALNIL